MNSVYLIKSPVYADFFLKKYAYLERAKSRSITATVLKNTTLIDLILTQTRLTSMEYTKNILAA
jgi:hypothetical protein